MTVSTLDLPVVSSKVFRGRSGAGRPLDRNRRSFCVFRVEQGLHTISQRVVQVEDVVEFDPRRQEIILDIETAHYNYYFYVRDKVEHLHLEGCHT